MTKTGRRDEIILIFDEIGEIQDLWQNF